MPLSKDIWNKAKEYWPLSDWQYEVANGNTKLGYDDWLAHQLESNNGNIPK